MGKHVEYSYQKLEIWKSGMNLVKKIYSITHKFLEMRGFLLLHK